MSAALQFPALARAAAAQRQAAANRFHGASAAAAKVRPTAGAPAADAVPTSPLRDTDLTPAPNFAFYRKHTETLLRRYLYASMLVGRAPSILTEPLMRGWASHRPVETFEDCVIFVLDMESALARLPRVERLLLTRVVLQEYSISEAALLLDKPERAIYRRLSEALDRLTGILLKNGTLKIPHRRRLRPDDDLDE